MTGEVLLRDVVRDDLPELFLQQQDPESVAMAGVPPRNRAEFAAHWEKILRDETVTVQAIALDGRLAGHIVAFERGGLREVGYWLGREFWGQGVASRALAAFLRRERARPLHARVARNNAASLRVLEKCGFGVCGEDRSPAREGHEEVDGLLLRLD